MKFRDTRNLENKEKKTPFLPSVMPYADSVFLDQFAHLHMLTMDLRCPLFCRPHVVTIPTKQVFAVFSRRGQQLKRARKRAILSIKYMVCVGERILSPLWSLQLADGTFLLIVKTII